MASKSSAKGSSDAAVEVTKLLVAAAAADTVYADIYRRRGRELFAPALSALEYEALKGSEKSIEDTLKQSRAATLQQDWAKVESLAGSVESLRRQVAEKGPLRDLAAAVYDNNATPLDPFSPGLDTLPGGDKDPAVTRDTLVANLTKLAKLDPSSAEFYESRKKFFSGLTLASRHSAAVTSESTTKADLEQLAAAAAQRGDMAELKRLAAAIRVREEEESKVEASAKPESKPSVAREGYQCPLDLAVKFPANVLERAGAMGLAAFRTEPMPEAASLFEFMATRIWQPDLSDGESEMEGTMRASAAVEEVGFKTELTGPVKTLLAQFLCNPFINSAGARYLPLFRSEEILVEDFPEDQAFEAKTPLLAAMKLEKRGALSRQDIDEALAATESEILTSLGLDVREYRLVCIPHDLFMRVGRERGWGQKQHWTHFDGFQVIRNGRRRALVGGDVRYGGLTDLVSIATTDRREGVSARFAVIRRARQVSRWR